MTDEIVNRHRFQLQAGKHPNARLQAAWNQFGGEHFAFEILDQIGSLESSEKNVAEELAALEEIWLEKLEPYGDRGYNVPKTSRDERLRWIAANRRGDW
jgi:hypothetical protein